MQARAWVSAALVILVALSWHGSLDLGARDATLASFNRALATYAIARTLNGVISVAQGTEIAIQPVGVGLTITAGEILDPLNDLVERFSWLVLAATTSLGIQMLIVELLGNVWINVLLSLSVAGLLLGLWWPRAAKSRGVLIKVCGAIAFVRFLFVAITLITALVNHTLLEPKQAKSIELIAQASEELGQLHEASDIDPESDFLDRLRGSLDVRAQLNAFQARVEETIGELVNLIVLYLVQTIILPISVLLLALSALKWFWRRDW